MGHAYWVKHVLRDDGLLRDVIVGRMEGKTEKREKEERYVG